VPGAESVQDNPIAVPARRLARAAYFAVRPVVRPVMHRMRNFFLQPQAQAMATLRSDIQQVRAAVSSMPVPVQVPVQPPPAPPAVSAELVEMRRLAAEVERVVLTLAIDGGQARLPAEPAEAAG
jgi:isochorismate hydrolase